MENIDVYGKVFGMLFVSCFGVPIPEELPVIYGGVQVGLAWGNDHSVLYWGIMLPFCIVSIALCDAMLYFIGYEWGEKLIKHRWIERNVLPREKREKIEKNFHEYGISILLFARLLPGLRMPIFIMSGVMHIPFRKFFLADAIYAIPGVTILFALGYWLGKEFEAAFLKIKENPLFVVLSIVVAVGGFLLYVYIRQRISTGDPKDIPMIGEKLAHMAHHEEPPTETPPQTPEPIQGTAPPEHPPLPESVQHPSGK